MTKTMDNKIMTVAPNIDQNLISSEATSRERLICDFLRAAAHEGRLSILNCLAEGEKSVLDLENILNYRQAAISQQLARLRLEGFVDFKRDGKTRFYYVKSVKIIKFLDFLNKEFSDG
ncbi:MAG: transcriptional regulator [Rhodobacteraceae bacterium]|jgi:ArsR family transcriptional regulator|nr:transcriptional regulator [Paracoccaceae bacterium]|tara:strand:- start:17267 stop:17620 length:354 start_codon:yes stop_codon:yes gene_type:complete